MAKDMVNHPPHYDGSTSMECIDAMELMLGVDGTKDYCLGNAFKYLWRYKNKNGKQDLDKAEWYLDRYAKLSDEDYLEIDERYQKMYDMIINAKVGLVTDETESEN